VKDTLPFHQQLRYEREQRGLSQEEVAEKINTAVKTVARWERGESFPRPYYRRRLAELFGKSPEALGLLEKAKVTELPQDQALCEDWGEAPHIVRFYGRNNESATLKQWIESERCQVVAVFGIGGIGKTTLTIMVAQQVKQAFDYVLWRSLQNAPPLKYLLRECILFASNQQCPDLPQGVDDQISLLIHYLRERRCLLILDNMESVMQAGQHAGKYQHGYESYGRFIQRLGEADHQSCLLLTSREKPKEIARLEGKHSSVRSLRVTGMGQTEGRALLQNRGLTGTDAQWTTLVNLYSGNPLALQLISESIQEIFGSDISAFLQGQALAFGDINALLDQQFQRLSMQEREVLYWLAIEREAVALEDLHENIVHPISRETLLEIFTSLARRSLVEKRGPAFTLQPVIMEYVTLHLVKQACKEFYEGVPEVWIHYAFIKALTKDYIRNSQIRLILKPLASELLFTLGKEGIEGRLNTMLSRQRQHHSQQYGYMAGNALNLLLHLGWDLRGADFSHLVIRQAYLQNATLPEVNFNHAHFFASAFTNTFGNILSAAFNPEGDRLIVGTATGEIRVYDVFSGTPLLTCSGHSDGVWSLAYSPDGLLLISSSDDATIRVWDMRTGQCLSILQDHTNRVRSVAFSPDGRLFASGSDDQTIRLWDVTTGRCLKILQGHTNRVWSVAFSPDGHLLASGSTDQTVRIWEMSSGQCLKILQGHTDWVRSVAFRSVGDTIASGSDDASIRLWEVGTGRCLETLHGHSRRVWSIAFSPDGNTLASGSEDQTIRLWDVNTHHCLKVLQGHKQGVRCIAFSPRGQLLASGGDDQTARLWDPGTHHCLKTLQGYTNRIWSVAFSSDGKTLVSGSEDQTIRLWDVNTERCFKILYDQAHGVRSVSFSPDGLTIASGGEDQTIHLWEATNGYLLKTLYGHTNWVRTVAFSADGTTLASGSEDQTIRLWDCNTGHCLMLLQGHSSWVRSVAFSPFGSLLASGSDDTTVRLWELTTGHCLHTLLGHTNRVRAVAFSPDGTVLATGSEDQSVRLWECSTGQSLIHLQGHTSWVRSVAFSPFGSLLASGSDDATIRLWDIANGQCLAILQGHDNRIRSVTFAPDGQTLASSSDDGMIKIWHINTARCLKTLISERPYEHMNITGVQGLTAAQKIALRTLGAIEHL
jgi:WD40 repeat protein/transcriptional regulator with XRE-family HTH domain